MHQPSMLTALLREQYGSHAVSIQPLHRHTLEDRGTYHVHLASCGPGVLHVFRHPHVATTLLKQAAILEYLAQCDYPAPRLIMTLTRQPIASYQNWSTLFTTFVEGSYGDFSYQSLTALAASLGKLHKLTEHIMTGLTTPLLPGSRFQLASAIPYALGQLLPEAHRVPSELWPLYSGLISTLHRIQQTSGLPITIVHANSWPQHAICTEQQEMVLIDWGEAGVGPAILDVSHLLLISQLKSPVQPRIELDAQAIAAVVRGYCGQRRLTSHEHSVLLDAVRFNIALDGAQHLPAILHSQWNQWRENAYLSALQARYEASAEIAELALQFFQ